MAFTEMGITQTDEYQETYDRFMEEYDLGKPVGDICTDILSELTEEFGADSGILHGVYYALAKCQWMCGGISEEILQKIRMIIDSNADLEFICSLGADDDMLKLRKRYLNRFYQNLQTPRKTVRRRKKDESEYIPVPNPQSPAAARFPNVSAGYLLAYPVEGSWRVCLVLSVGKLKEYVQIAYCFVWAEKFRTVPDMRALMTCRGLPLGIVPGDSFPENFEIVGWVPPTTGMPGLIGYAYPMWRSFISNAAKREQFYKEFPKQMCLNYGDVINKVTDIVNGKGRI